MLTGFLPTYTSYMIKTHFKTLTEIVHLALSQITNPEGSLLITTVNAASAYTEWGSSQ